MEETTSLGGIINLGLTCYANAVIQCIRHCKHIENLFQEDGKYKELLKKDDKNTLMTSSFAEVVQMLKKCKRGQRVKPLDFLTKFRDCISTTGFSHLASQAPHDSYEFYLCLLDMLHESMAQEVKMNIMKDVLNAKDTRHAQALGIWKKEFEKKYSPFVESSYGLLYFVVQCSNCRKETYRWEPMTAIKAVVESNKTSLNLKEMLDAEFVEEEFDDYDCENCRPTRQKATRKTYVWKLPKYVVVVLKRFTFDGRRINTPLVLDDHTVSFKHIFSEKSPEYNSTGKYVLTSILDHHGGAGGGHYTAQCKRNGVWTVYDDESIHTRTCPHIGYSNYMLWFTGE